VSSSVGVQRETVDSKNLLTSQIRTVSGRRNGEWLLLMGVSIVVSVYLQGSAQ